VLMGTKKDAAFPERKQGDHKRKQERKTKT
jgi:hypothetical protein